MEGPRIWRVFGMGVMALIITHGQGQSLCCEAPATPRQSRTAPSEAGGAAEEAIPALDLPRERIKVRGLFYHPETVYDPASGRPAETKLTVLLSATEGLVGRKVLVTLAEAQNECTRGCNSNHQVSLEYVDSHEKTIRTLSSEHLTVVEFTLRHPNAAVEGIVKHRAFIGLLQGDGDLKQVDYKAEYRTMKACDPLTLR